MVQMYIDRLNTMEYSRCAWLSLLINEMACKMAAGMICKCLHTGSKKIGGTDSIRDATLCTTIITGFIAFKFY